MSLNRELDMVKTIFDLDKENLELKEALRIADETSGELNRWIRNLQEQRDRLEKEKLEWEGRCYAWERLCKEYQKSLDDSIQKMIDSMKGESENV